MRWSPPEQKAQTPSRGDGPFPVRRTQPTSARLVGVLEGDQQLVDGVGPEGVAHLGAVEGDADRAVRLGPVVGDVGEVEPGHFGPRRLVEEL